ncbi:Aste57867_12922 [Aphanomyces stellatus]|uniref:Aste57867_12922 protein n=1 Tax=Aphanomyces stellatus TaxID=120398 RepID=A0A485KXI5_9STRA|nr:hypothetical protein As57867_012874 [Aphanomyces stellatus]VFT89768.1 Aste57867_12922 [Aphanomyces stellatus]
MNESRWLPRYQKQSLTAPSPRQWKTSVSNPPLDRTPTSTTMPTEFQATVVHTPQADYEEINKDDGPLVLANQEAYIAQLEEAGYEEDKTFSNLPLHLKLFWGVFYFCLSIASPYFFMVAVKGGVVATAVLYSSGTVTSITVALVGAKGLTVRQGVPIIMGANVGTCVTCIMVAFAQVAKREQFERAMAAATDHDMYNIWSVIVMFPIELLFHPLELMSLAMAGGKTSNGQADDRKVLTGKALCEKAKFLKAGMFYDKVVLEKSMSQSTAGGIGAVIGFYLLVFSLVLLVHMLQKLFRGSAQKTIPIGIGANLGTTVTALLASWVTGSPDAVAIALVHFWLNVLGIFMFYPIPITRYPILQWARRLTYYSARWPVVAAMFSSCSSSSCLVFCSG